MNLFNWIKLKFFKKQKVIFVIDEDLDIPKIKVGFLVKKLNRTGQSILVRIPSLGNRVFNCTWKGSNYYLVR